MSLTANQQQDIAYCVSLDMDVQDDGSTITIYGEQRDVMRAIARLEGSFGFGNVVWRTVRGSDTMVVVTIDVDAANAPRKGGEWGDADRPLDRPTNGYREETRKGGWFRRG